MSPVTQTPPRWAEILLERLLAARDRETVAGDLREEYADSIVPRRGRLRADLWYLRQVSSFLPRFISQGGSMKKTLLSVSFFTFASTCWLTLMEIVLRHPGYLLRVGVSVSIALISSATISILVAKSGVRGERWLWAGAVILIGIGGQAFLRNARAAHFEGFVFLISAALLFQGVLMLLCSATRRGRDRDLPGKLA
jgi:hypothetical protein